MEVVLGVGIGILTISGIVFSRLITTFFHELGHTISALIFTDGPVHMYVGSYGDERRSLKIKLGRLSVFISFIIWDLEIGLCTHRKSESLVKNLIIILSGPLFSLILGLLLLYFFIQDNFSDGQKFVLAIFIFSSIWDFVVNLIPRTKATMLNDGSMVYNDGQQLVDLLSKSKFPLEYDEAMDESNIGNFEAALAKIEALESDEKKERYYYEAKLEIYHKQQDSHSYISFFEEYLSIFNPAIKFVGYWAEAKIRIHAYDEVVEKLTKIIFDGKSAYQLYFQRGKALIELGEYNDAMRDFHALTLGAIEDPLALANRAYCQFRLGYEDEAKEDVLQAIQHAKFERGEIFYFAGVIFENSDEEKALEFYKKAESLKYDHHALPFNISRIEKFK